MAPSNIRCYHSERPTTSHKEGERRAPIWYSLQRHRRCWLGARCCLSISMAGFESFSLPHIHSGTSTELNADSPSLQFRVAQSYLKATDRTSQRQRAMSRARRRCSISTEKQGLAYACRDGTVGYGTFSTTLFLFRRDRGSCRLISASSNGDYIIAAGVNGDVTILDRRTNLPPPTRPCIFE